MSGPDDPAGEPGHIPPEPFTAGERASGSFRDQCPEDIRDVPAWALTEAQEARRAELHAAAAEYGGQATGSSRSGTSMNTASALPEGLRVPVAPASTRARRAGRRATTEPEWWRELAEGEAPGHLVPAGQHRHRAGVTRLRPGPGPGQRRRHHPGADPGAARQGLGDARDRDRQDRLGRPSLLLPPARGQAGRQPEVPPGTGHQGPSAAWWSPRRRSPARGRTASSTSTTEAAPPPVAARRDRRGREAAARRAQQDLSRGDPDRAGSGPTARPP